MPNIILLKGLPASGKTTWATQYVVKTGNTVRVNKDNLRAMLYEGEWTGKREKFVLAVRDSIIWDAMLANQNVIVDDTNLHPKHQERIQQLVQDFNKNLTKGQYILQIKDDFLKTTPQECVERDKNRLNQVGSSVIWDMYRRYVEDTEKDPVEKSEKPQWITGVPSAIICDIDGTIALHNGRSPYDGTRVMEDSLNEPVADILRIYEEKNADIIFVSGRSEGEHYSTRELTEKWLQINGFQNYLLYMRNEGDNQKDATLKEEIYRDHIENKYNVLFVLDDRNQTVAKWRDLGLTCLQVAPGDF